MDEKILNVEEASKLANLHPKTITRLIKEGKIKANKIGRQWRIKESEIRFFLNGEEADTSTQKNSSFEFSGEIDTNTQTLPNSKIQVSTVIDVLVENSDEATMISNTLIAVLNCKDPEYGNATYKFIYYEAEKKARYLLWGTPVFINKILSLLVEIAPK